MADWQAIKAEYITTDTSYRKLAKKYGISHVQIGNVGKEENWVELRKQYLDEALAKTVDNALDERVDRMTRVMDLTDKLLDKIEQAINEVDITLFKHVDKTKVIEYNNAERPDKPTKETVHEEEKVLEVKTIIDRAGLRQITAALKDIKEVQMLKSELDRKEQEARIANLQKQVEKDDDSANAPTLVITGLPEEFKV